MSEIFSKKRLALVTSIVALGTLAACGKTESAASPAAKKPVCDSAAQINQIVKHVAAGDSFTAKAIESRKRTGFVTVEPKHSTALRGILNPLVITCDNKIVDYVGITAKPNDSPGRPHKIGSELYLNVAKPTDVHISGSGKFIQKQFQEQVVHPFGTGVPGFVEQPVPAGATDQQIADRAFGLMANEL